jgi:glycosyltransferase involved in cell wall biosynthesis
LELVLDGVNGFVTPPTPQEIARAFDELWEDRALAQQLGERGTARLVELGINWDTVISKFLR